MSIYFNRFRWFRRLQNEYPKSNYMPYCFIFVTTKNLNFWMFLGENSRSMRQATELKTSQPIFPGQPPPLARVDHNKQNYSQPPPRQSSQVPQRSSTSVNRTAFPGQAPPGVATSTSSAASNFREPLFQVILFSIF